MKNIDWLRDLRLQILRFEKIISVKTWKENSNLLYILVYTSIKWQANKIEKVESVSFIFSEIVGNFRTYLVRT